MSDYPLFEDNITGQPVDAPASGEAPEFSVLLVDDESSNLKVLSRILGADYTLYAAKSGETALKLALERKPELILLDVIMPDKNGFEVLSELKNCDATRDIPVIFITGLSSIEDEERGFSLGAVDYITKPFHATIVKARVRTHLEIVRQMRAIERFGLMDVLTGIPNRRCFEHQLNIEWPRAIREKSKITLLVVDVDNFKTINDTYGHHQGDLILKSVAKALVLSVRRMTDLAFRWGGDEFAVMLPSTDANGAIYIAEKIRTKVESLKLMHFETNEQLQITVSIGAATAAPEPDDDFIVFHKLADKALYAAKNAGRNKSIHLNYLG